MRSHTTPTLPQRTSERRVAMVVELVHVVVDLVDFVDLAVEDEVVVVEENDESGRQSMTQ